MSIWVYRTEKEYEEKIINDGRIYLNWKLINCSLEGVSDTEGKKIVKKYYPWWSREEINTRYYQIYPIVNAIGIGDLIMLPSKLSNTFHFGRVTGKYGFDESAEGQFKHYRSVDWFATNISRDIFDSQILYDTNIHSNVGKVKNEEVVERIMYMVEHDWQEPRIMPFDEEQFEVDLEQAAKSAISKYVFMNFKGYAMEDLIAEILRAKGFTVYNGPKGPDGGQDLLAAGGDMGFSSPRICVQVKTQNSKVDKETVYKLLKTTEKFHAEYGLFVAWNGYEKDVKPADIFFNIRLWTSSDVIEELLENYDKLSIEMQNKIPLKHVWVLNDVREDLK